jgi:error-prone DNA polymerase
MGFYAPAQIVRDAREHGVEVRPVEVNLSDWDCTLECAANSPASVPIADKRTWGITGPAVRLGFRMIKGLQAAHAQQIVERRVQHGPFHSIDDFHAATELPVSAVAKLSEADAFASLPRSRRIALWETLALPEERSPLAMPPAQSATPALPLMTVGQEIHADYGTTGLSLKGHPVQLIRTELSRRKVIPAAEVWNRPHGRWVSVAGVVIIRQRPGTAKGIVFETLEDETGIVNLIIRPDVYDRCRNAARNASVLQADGYVERQGQVQHVMAVRLHDLTELVSNCSLRSRDFH